MFVPLGCYRSVVLHLIPLILVFFILLISTGAYSSDTNVAPPPSLFLSLVVSLPSSRWNRGLKRLHVHNRSSPGGRHLAYCCWFLQVCFLRPLHSFYHPQLAAYSVLSYSPAAVSFFGFLVSKTGASILVDVLSLERRLRCSVGLLYHLVSLLT